MEKPRNGGESKSHNSTPAHYKTIVLSLNLVSPRTELLARALKADLEVIRSKPPYLLLLARVLFLIKPKRTDQVIIQLPTGPLLFAMSVVKLLHLTKRLVADVHTGFLSAFELSKHGLLNGPFRGFLKYADLIIIHNETNWNLLPKNVTQKTVVLYDPFYTINKNLALADASVNSLERLVRFAVFPASWHPDEPILSLIDAWSRFVTQITLVITGRSKPDIIAKISSQGFATRVILTGQLASETYFRLVAGSEFVVVATTSEYDAQASSYEALAFSKPIVATDTRAIRLTIGDAAAYFDISKPESLAAAVDNVVNNHTEYEAKSRSRSIQIEKETRDGIEKYLLL